MSCRCLFKKADENFGLPAFFSVALVVLEKTTGGSVASSSTPLNTWFSDDFLPSLRELFWVEVGGAVGAFAPFGEGDDFTGDALADAALALPPGPAFPALAFVGLGAGVGVALAATLVGFATALDAAFGAGLAAALLAGFGEAF